MDGDSSTMKYFVILPLIAVGLIGAAYAEPLEEINTEILKYSDSSVTVNVSWNNDPSVFQYEIGCVSCIPNMNEDTKENTITLHNITMLDDGRALLYILAYDDSEQIISGKQIILETR